MQALYDELAPWWPLLSPPEAMADETAQILRWLKPTSLLELGSGAGLLAHNVPAEVELELVDLAPAMLEVSRKLNPSRKHHLADLTTLTLSRTFDAVLLHDAVMYLPSVEALRAAVRTAWNHLEPGGRFVVLPDFVEETFVEHANSGGASEPGRAIQMLEWHWDPTPDDGQVEVEFVVLTREEGEVRSIHETHKMASHPLQTYWTVLQEVGFLPLEIPFDDLRPEGLALLAERP